MRKPAILALLFAVSGCVADGGYAQRTAGMFPADAFVPVAAGGEIIARPDAAEPAAIDAGEARYCSRALPKNNPAPGEELDSADIDVINWNIHKGNDPDWMSDLKPMAAESDLMIFQEVSFNSDDWHSVVRGRHRSFAPGYRTSGLLSGVMTLSSAAPLMQCNLSIREPWLRSPKATVITEYGLTNTEQTLLVINIHAVNFTFGVSDFTEQLRRALDIVDEHDGPVLLSGDFNTWRMRREEILQDMAGRLGLERLEYDEDHRRRAFGLPLDHIYVRGLRVVDATTSDVDSSDHNPMSARLSM